MKFSFYSFPGQKNINVLESLCTKGHDLLYGLEIFCLKFPHIVLENVSFVNFLGPFASEFKYQNFSWLFL